MFMNEWVDFFWIPYAQTSFSGIVLEVIGVLFGTLGVVFSQWANIWTYPMGIVSTTIYIYLTFRAALYGDMIINIYYTAMGLYGWYMWTRKRGTTRIFSITFSKRMDYLQAGLLFLMTMLFTIVVYYISGKLRQTYAWIDIFTTGICFAGMYQMAMKKVESWLFWLVGNIISIPLYFYKGLVLTSIQFFIFTGLSIMGYCMWKKKAKEDIYSLNSK
ncbi:MAG: nicotinamide riboside transporter PnuC [Flavobacteriales bacterium AspAUS03]